MFRYACVVLQKNYSETIQKFQLENCHRVAIHNIIQCSVRWIFKIKYTSFLSS
jgi:hypothetical protein